MGLELTILGFRSDALPTKLASLTQGWSIAVDVYTRSDTEATNQLILHRILTNFKEKGK